MARHGKTGHSMCVAAATFTTECVAVRGGGVKKIVGGVIKGSEGEIHIQVEGEVLLKANPCKSCNRFLNNYKAEFGLKQYLICGAELAYARVHF